MLKLQLSAIHYEADEATKKYAKKKFGNIDRYLDRKTAKLAHIDVKLSSSKKGGSKNRCEATLHIGNVQLKAEESTNNMMAAIDVVEAKLKNQLRRHKQKHQSHKADRKGSLRKLRKLADRDFFGRQN